MYEEKNAFNCNPLYNVKQNSTQHDDDVIECPGFFGYVRITEFNFFHLCDVRLAYFNTRKQMIIISTFYNFLHVCIQYHLTPHKRVTESAPGISSTVLVVSNYVKHLIIFNWIFLTAYCLPSYDKLCVDTDLQNERYSMVICTTNDDAYALLLFLSSDLFAVKDSINIYRIRVFYIFLPS